MESKGVVFSLNQGGQRRHLYKGDYEQRPEAG